MSEMTLIEKFDSLFMYDSEKWEMQWSVEIKKELEGITKLKAENEELRRVVCPHCGAKFAQQILSVKSLEEK